MSTGWECPKCGKVYAPFVKECEECNKEEEQQTLEDFIEEHQQPVIPINIPYMPPYNPCCGCPNQFKGVCNCTIPHRKTVTYSNFTKGDNLQNINTETGIYFKK